MSSRTTRIIKEARGLLWPWCGVMIAGAATRFAPDSGGVELQSRLGFFAWAFRCWRLLLSATNSNTARSFPTQPAR